MLKVKESGQFKRDYRKCVKRGLDIKLLKDVISTLAIPEQLSTQHKNHTLAGTYAGLMECHILPDWLLIYYYDGEYLALVRTGTHADLFRK